MSAPRPASSADARHARRRPRGTRSGWLRRRWRDERGSASIELVILLPAMFAVMFLGLQGALYFHARNVAMAAASEGARAAAVEDGRTSDGIGAATTFVADAGGDRVLADLTVSGARGPGQVVISVSGTSLSVIPGWQPRVTATGSATTERLTGEP